MSFLQLKNAEFYIYELFRIRESHKSFLKNSNDLSHLSGRSQVLTCSLELGSVETDCGLVTQGRSPPTTVSGLGTTDCGWCAAETPAW